MFQCIGKYSYNTLGDRIPSIEIVFQCVGEYDFNALENVTLCVMNEYFNTSGRYYSTVLGNDISMRGELLSIYYPNALGDTISMHWRM